jgi:hypothetical protein
VVAVWPPAQLAKFLSSIATHWEGKPSPRALVGGLLDELRQVELLA